MGLNLLIIDAYSTGGREKTLAAGGTPAGDLFTRAVHVHRPEAATHTMRFDTTTPDMPEGLDRFDGVIWSGSNLTMHRPNPLIDAQVDFARAVYGKGIPQFGCCYGLQVAAVAAGGVVEASPNGPEIGWARDIELTPEGRAHAMYDGKDGSFNALCWHADTVTTLPDGAQLLAGNGHSRVQAAIISSGPGTFWATQYHLEFDGYEVARLVDRFPDNVDNADALVTEMDGLKALEDHPEDAAPGARAVVDSALRTAEMGNWLTWLEQQK